MKNLHIIATEKPSLGKYLVFNKEGNLCIWETNTMGSQRRLLRQHIYITSDEKLPYDSTIFHTGAFYHIDFVGDVHIINKDTHYPNPNFCSRIILTTDESLFKYGVQAIDDEFLEWFVKNQSCEEIEVELISVNEFGSEISVNGYGFAKFIYKIIILKEEPKQERMYSEEDMEEAFTNGLNRSFDSDFDRWFEQFKKK